ncbi:hypothetical protein [Chryseobacterium gregarium]|uniref:hypothetical protein n=1 Tax=Chryseobacterium gregarium TaxID=456299 RepID=UPI0003FE1441|nr:hypothetical protein [Chryseobacterium gregarium]
MIVIHNVSHDLQKFFQDILESFKDLLSEVQEAIDRKEINYPDAQVFLSDLFSLSSFSYIFNNFFSTLKIPLHKKSIFDDCNNKNRRILNILFESN